MSLPTAASCLSRASPCRNNGSTLLLLPEAVLRCRSVCNRRAAAERLAILFPAMRDVCRFPKQWEMARPSIVDARITSRAICN
jgi:hypothetical protein